MPNTLKSTYNCRHNAVLSNQSGLSVITNRIDASDSGTLASNLTGNSFADQAWQGGIRTIAPLFFDTINLKSGGLSDGMDGTISMLRVKEVSVKNISTDPTCEIVVTGFGYDEYQMTINAWTIPAGASIFLNNPRGYILEGAADHIIVDNLSHSATASYEIAVVGSSIL